MMAIGAFTGAAVSYYTGSPWTGFIAAGFAGAVFGLIHAVASVTHLERIKQFQVLRLI